METKKIGNFEVDVSAPHPCWIEIRHVNPGLSEPGTIIFSHTELAELHKVIKWASGCAMERLGKSASEAAL